MESEVSAALGQEVVVVKCGDIVRWKGNPIHLKR